MSLLEFQFGYKRSSLSPTFVVRNISSDGASSRDSLQQLQLLFLHSHRFVIYSLCSYCIEKYFQINVRLIGF